MILRAAAVACWLLAAGGVVRAQQAATTGSAPAVGNPLKLKPKPHSHRLAAHGKVHAKLVQTVPVIKPHHAGPARHAGIATQRAHLARKPPPAPVEAPKPRPPALQATPEPANIGRNTGLPLPRYASLKSDDVNMRVGPAERYPVLWTYKRRDLPVKIEREWDIWRLVEDMDGIKGWVHQATLTGRRSFVITGTENHILRADASDTADEVAVLKPGVVGRIRSCEAGKIWCQVQVQDYRGWLKRDDVWGVDAEEAIAP